MLVMSRATLYVTYPATTVLNAPNTMHVIGFDSLYAETAVKVAARKIRNMYRKLQIKLVHK